MKIKVKVMLVDDHPLFIEGLQYLLETHGISVIGLVTDGREALEKARLLAPDIILMDIKMPKSSGLDALILIKAEMPEIKIIMLTTSEEDTDLFDAIKYGASGFLLKSTNAKELVNMINNIEEYEIPFLQQILSQQDVGYTKLGQLTERQLEVLEMVAKGITYKEMGIALGLTERTVKYHMERILELLHLKNRAELISYATRMGIVEET